MSDNPFRREKSKEEKMRERVMIGQTGDFYPCDICDQMNFPHISWHCTHDDPDHVTTICHKCLAELNRRTS